MLSVLLYACYARNLHSVTKVLGKLFYKETCTRCPKKIGKSKDL